MLAKQSDAIDAFIPLYHAADEESPATPKCRQGALIICPRTSFGGIAQSAAEHEADSTDHVPN
jgi:hypothetical protein